MKCTNCGFENEQDFAFCPQCGAASESTAIERASSEMPNIPATNPLADKTLAALKHPLFLTICILVSVAALFGLANDGLPLLHILATVFLWIIFAKSRKGDVHTEMMRCISGVVFADYVISYVVTGLLIAIGGLLTAVIAIAAGSATIFDEIVNGLGLMDAEYIDLVEILLSASGVIVFLIFVLLAAVIFVLNFFGTRKIHEFIKSLYQANQNGTSTVLYVKESKTWLLVLGILSAVFGITSLANIAIGAAMIIASVLVGKCFAAE